MTTLAFFGEPALKAAVRKRVAEHRRLDQIAQGAYWEDGRGCFIGCSLHSDRHEDFRRLLGLPVWIAYLGESIFENLPKQEALEFPLALYDAIPVGADLKPVYHLWLAWLIHDVSRFNGDARVLEVAALHERAGNGGVVTDAAWAAARAAAWAAARAAAGDAARAAAGDAARAAAGAAAGDAARAAAGDAARDAARDAALAAAGTAARRHQRDKLVELLRATKPVEGAAPQLPLDPGFAAYYECVTTGNC